MPEADGGAPPRDEGGTPTVANAWVWSANTATSDIVYTTNWATSTSTSVYITYTHDPYQYRTHPYETRSREAIRRRAMERADSGRLSDTDRAALTPAELALAEERNSNYAVRRAERLRREQEEEQRALERHRLANERAEEYLMSLLNPRQQRTWTEHKWFRFTSPSGRNYQMNTGVTGNVDFYHGEFDGSVTGACCHPRDTSLPIPDIVASQYLFIKYDEEGFLRMANSFKYSSWPPEIYPDLKRAGTHLEQRELTPIARRYRDEDLAESGVTLEETEVVGEAQAVADAAVREDWIAVEDDYVMVDIIVDDGPEREMALL